MAAPNARGKALINILPLEQGERITSLLPVKEFSAERYVFMATSDGTVKKTSLDFFSRPRAAGLIAIDLGEGDHLVGTAITDGENDILLFSSSGKSVRFRESDVRPMGRSAHGVRGMRLAAGHTVVSLIVPDPLLPEVQGVIAMQVSERNGRLVGALGVASTDQIMLSTDQGTLLRTGVQQISLVSRNTQGVRLMNVRDGEKIAGFARVAEAEADVDADAAAPTNEAAPDA